MARDDARGLADRLGRRPRRRYPGRRSGVAARRAAREARALRLDGDREAVDVCARPRTRAEGYAGRAIDRAQCRARRLPNDVDRSRHRRQLPVPAPDEDVRARGAPRATHGVTAMLITRKHLPRRTVLRGMGAAIALPLLDAMVPALAQSSAPRPFRFGAIYMPNGVYPDLWHPMTVGKDFEFQPIMKPLEPLREYVTTISRIQAPPGERDNGGIHMGASAAFLNGV